MDIQKLEELKSLVVGLQKRNDELTEKFGKLPTLEKEEFERRNAAIDRLVDDVKALQTAANRTPAPQPTEEKAAQIEKANLNLRAALKRMFRDDYVGPQAITILSPKHALAMGQAIPELKGLSVDSDPLGGYLVHPTMSASIDQKVFEQDPMRGLAGEVTISTDSFKEPADYGDPECNWVGERQTRAETTSSNFDQLEIPVKEMEQMPSITQALLDDAAFDLEAYLIERASRAFARKEGDGFVNGNGVLQPRGFLGYTAGTGYGQVEQVASGTSADFDGDDLIGLQDTLLEDFQPGAVWAMRRATRSFCRTLKDGQGRYLFSVDGGLNGGVQELLLGKPVRLFPGMPAIGANSLSVAYADFKRFYAIVNRIGLRILRDPYSSKPNVLLYMTRRVGGGCRAFQAGKLLKLGA